MNDNSDSEPRPVPQSRKSSELADAIRLAHRFLDDNSRDPDSDESMLSRQLLRALERETICRKMAVDLSELLLGMFSNLPPDMQDLPQAERARAIVSRIIETWQ